jgi:2-hydroxychromene-2-carboxylate isomerase
MNPRQSDGRRLRLGPMEMRFSAASTAQPGAEARAALEEFDAHACPGVPTVIVDGERFFGKDRVDWIIEACQRHGRHRPEGGANR